MKNIGLIEALIRWSQYRWADLDQYCSDIELLAAEYLKVADPSVTYELFRGCNGIVQALRFLDGSQIKEERQHECWTTDYGIAHRFSVQKQKGNVIRKNAGIDDVLFDVEALSSKIPEEVKGNYYDLQNLESEVVLRLSA
jgi:hypothetical protein